MNLRLGFSVVLHLRPDVLLVDEILAVGDESFQRQCRETLRRLQRDEGKSIVFVSHDLDTIADIATRGLARQRPSAHVRRHRRSARGLPHRLLRPRRSGVASGE